ncbi:hypothetical protein HPB48_000430 [Haemaphysalis longicornis]|uniref:Uncharacterized protein n=1 Tax=Haemaphysalis longicornis TaxID=44386 RepID=A0A9J6GHI3_HAELO|nr:hypothetical protein HPB48_000430 [Haemaphysalis longicornis]
MNCGDDSSSGGMVLRTSLSSFAQTSVVQHIGAHAPTVEQQMLLALKFFATAGFLLTACGLNRCSRVNSKQNSEARYALAVVRLSGE